MLSLLKNNKFYRALGPVAAGTTDQKSAGINGTGLDTITFIVGVGTITTTALNSIKLQGSDTDVDGNYADLVTPASSITITEDKGSKLFIIEIVRPQYVFTRLYFDRGTANTVIDFILAISGCNVRNCNPITQPSDVAGSLQVVSSIQ